MKKQNCCFISQNAICSPSWKSRNSRKSRRDRPCSPWKSEKSIIHGKVRRFGLNSIYLSIEQPEHNLSRKKWVKLGIFSRKISVNWIELNSDATKKSKRKWSLARFRFLSRKKLRWQTKRLSNNTLGNFVELLSLVSPHDGGVDIRPRLVVWFGQHRYNTQQNLLNALDRTPSFSAQFVAHRVIARCMQDRYANATVGKNWNFGNKKKIKIKIGMVVQDFMHTHCLDGTFRMWTSFSEDSRGNPAEIPVLREKHLLQSRFLQDLCLGKTKKKKNVINLSAHKGHSLRPLTGSTLPIRRNYLR